MGVVDRGIQGEMKSSDRIVDCQSVVGTPDYLAPEVVMALQHSQTVDFWSLGVIIYEFLYGIPPFHAETEVQTFANILAGDIDFSRGIEIDVEVSKEGMDLIRQLLQRDNRLGSQGIEEIMNHPWFGGIDWEHIEAIESPFKPSVNMNAPSTEYFEDRYHFKQTGEQDILDDIRDARDQREHVDVEAERKSTLKLEVEPPAEAEVESADSALVKQFPAVSLKRLERLNVRFAQELRSERGRSLSGASRTEVIVEPLSPPLFKVTNSRMMPRSFSLDQMTEKKVQADIQ
jgi:serine/threonine protein kinase